MGAGYCQWGGITNRNICNIYGDAHIPKIMPTGPSAAAGEVETYVRKEGRKARKYIRMIK